MSLLKDVHDRAKTPDPTVTSPSPARDALRSSLSVVGTDAELTLKKRKSWFGSVKDIFHRSALSAKAAVDGVRGDQVKGDEG